VSKNIVGDSIRLDGSAQSATIHDVQLKKEAKNDDGLANKEQVGYDTHGFLLRKNHCCHIQIADLTKQLDGLKVKGAQSENLHRVLTLQLNSLDETLTNVGLHI
jgi:hypothetical protein